IEVLLKALASFIFKPISNRLFSSSLIYFLAVLGINFKIDCLRKVKHYLYILTSVIYCVRVLS
ncbi:hypothetical protein BKA63DRAFT_377827, partial [Paraphoma chrysanthemicola]